MRLNAYYARSRKLHRNVVLNEAAGVVTLKTRQVMSSSKLVLLPATGLLDASGEPIHLGDFFTRIVAGKEETFYVGPLPRAGVLVKDFELVGYRRKVAGKLAGGAPSLPLTPAVVATLRRGGNVFTQPEAVVPEKTPYCYRSLGWNGAYLQGVMCPFWNHSDHGMVYCHLRQLGSLTDEAGARSDEERRKALAHFGSEKAVEASDQVGLLWDQVKCCGISDREVYADDEA